MVDSVLQLFSCGLWTLRVHLFCSFSWEAWNIGSTSLVNFHEISFSPSFLFFFFFLPSLLDPFQLLVQYVLVLFCSLLLTIREIFFPCRTISHQKHLDKLYCNQKTVKYNWYYKFRLILFIFRLILNTWNNNCHLKSFWVNFSSKPCLKFQKGKLNLYKK